MHASSLENMHKCYERYLRPDALANKQGLKVLDVGGADVNGNYRSVFAGPGIEYLTADIDATGGVDLLMRDPYSIPVDDGTIDVVLSGQMLEHCEFFWMAFGEMVRVLQPGGFIFLIAPSAGPIHRYPVDCYRFYPDAFHALARHANCHLVDVWLDERGPWRDLVGVFAKRDLPRFVRTAPSAAEGEHRSFAHARGSVEEERTQGGEGYIDFLSRLHARLEPGSYLEIGVRRGASLALAACPAVGVDPFPRLEGVELPSSTRIVQSTSDDFFELHADAMTAAPVELAFIDGMHLFEYALRDFMNIERRAEATSLVVIDDIFPNHVAQAHRQRRTRVWTGDIWKLRACLAQHRPDLVLVAVDTHPSGMLLIAGLDPANRVLWDRYNPIVRQYAADSDPPPDILSRKAALGPYDSRIEHLLLSLRRQRGKRPAPREVAEGLRSMLAQSEDIR
jgi:SAM-dependent methyltransferase